MLLGSSQEHIGYVAAGRRGHFPSVIGMASGGILYLDFNALLLVKLVVAEPS